MRIWEHPIETHVHQQNVASRILQRFEKYFESCHSLFVRVRVNDVFLLLHRKHQPTILNVSFTGPNKQYSYFFDISKIFVISGFLYVLILFCFQVFKFFNDKKGKQFCHHVCEVSMYIIEGDIGFARVIYVNFEWKVT